MVCHTTATQGTRRVESECQVWKSSGFPQSLSPDIGPLSHRLQKPNRSHLEQNLMRTNPPRKLVPCQPCGKLGD